MQYIYSRHIYICEIYIYRIIYIVYVDMTSYMTLKFLHKHMFFYKDGSVPPRHGAAQEARDGHTGGRV
jgi:hypothetical protein